MAELRVWIDQDLCTGDGLCVDHCPEVFVLLEDGISYVRSGDLIGNDPGGAACPTEIPQQLEDSAIEAALDCPGECIFIETAERNSGITTCARDSQAVSREPAVARRDRC